MDSIDKIITRYFSLVTKIDFEYKGKLYQPKLLKISPLLLRDYICPAGCGGCCHQRFSLDYLPEEEFPYYLMRRKIDFNGKEIIIYSDVQKDHIDSHCKHLDFKDGRCGIYLDRPFSCDFELIRPLSFLNPKTPNVLTQKLFGRGWNMKRIDGERGALCEMLPITKHSIDEVIRKLKRLQQWCDYFGVVSKCPEIIEWINIVRKFSLIKLSQISPIVLT